MSVNDEPINARPLRAATHTYAGGWRGALLQSVVGQTATIRVLAEAHIVRVFSGALSDVPTTARAIGDPLVVRLTGSGLADYSLAEIRGSTFARADAPRDQAGAVARGEYRYGIVPPDITGESKFIDWDAQDRRNASRQQTGG